MLPLRAPGREALNNDPRYRNIETSARDNFRADLLTLLSPGTRPLFRRVRGQGNDVGPDRLNRPRGGTRAEIRRPFAPRWSRFLG